MKLTMEDLSAALDLVSLVPGQKGITSSQYVRISASGWKALLALAGVAIAEASAPAEATEAWATFYLDRRVLSAFASAHARAKHVDLNINNGVLTIKSGGGKVSVEALAEEPSGYGAWKKGKGATEIEMPGFASSSLPTMAEFTPQSSFDDYLKMVYLVEGYGVIASDAFSLVCIRSDKVAATIPIPAGPLIGNKKMGHLIADNGGVAVVSELGYVYQSLPASDKEYPLKQMQKMVEHAGKAKTLAVMKVSDLHTAIEYLSGFSFAADSESITVTGKPGSPTVLELRFAQGGAQRRVPCVPESEFSYRWPMKKAASWIGLLAATEGIENVETFTMESMYGMRSKVKGTTYIWLVPEAA